jgi:putative endonuclease
MEKKKRTQPKPTHNQRLGKWGEDAAWRYLQEQGVEMLAANVRTQYGEIDLIGSDGGTLVFFEVKTRRTKAYGYPEQSVDKRKQEHMLNSALDYLQSHPEIEGDWRIDVLALEKEARQDLKVTWFKNAVSG